MRPVSRSLAGGRLKAPSGGPTGCWPASWTLRKQGQLVESALQPLAGHSIEQGGQVRASSQFQESTWANKREASHLLAWTPYQEAGQWLALRLQLERNSSLATTGLQFARLPNQPAWLRARGRPRNRSNPSEPIPTVGLKAFVCQLRPHNLGHTICHCSSRRSPAAATFN